jgi:hypothetical protein
LGFVLIDARPKRNALNIRWPLQGWRRCQGVVACTRKWTGIDSVGTANNATCHSADTGRDKPLTTIHDVLHDVFPSATKTLQKGFDLSSSMSWKIDRIPMQTRWIFYD